MDAYPGLTGRRRRGAQSHRRIPAAGGVVAVADAWDWQVEVSTTTSFLRRRTRSSALLAEYPKSDSSAEAAYYLGVSRYKRTHNVEELKKTIQHLQRDFPQSEWVKRASVYQML